MSTLLLVGCSFLHSWLPQIHGHAWITSTGSLVYGMVIQPDRFFNNREIPKWYAYVSRTSGAIVNPVVLQPCGRLYLAIYT
jgi:hypothetical protein